MNRPTIAFDDGAAYERSMGVWSRLIGSDFILWLDMPAQRRWLDVGCGNGAFTELIVDRCAPNEVHGIDLAPAQIAYAEARPAAQLAEFRQGNAMALPYADVSFDAAVMALVIAFVPDPARALAEMARVVRPGGIVATYTWERSAGGMPHDPLLAALAGTGRPAPVPPDRASSTAALRALWADAGLEAIETTEILVEKTFDDFDAYWRNVSATAIVVPILAAMSDAERARVRADTRARLSADASGRITQTARANAIKGRKAQ